MSEPPTPSEMEFISKAYRKTSIKEQAEAKLETQKYNKFDVKIKLRQGTYLEPENLNQLL